MTKKEYVYKVFNVSDTVVTSLNTTWRDEVVSTPMFKAVLNGSDSELVVRLARPFDDFGEDDDVKLNNKVEAWVYDKEAPAGTLLYSGYIIGYSNIVNEEKEFVDVRVRGYGHLLSTGILRNGNSTTISYYSKDPSVIFRDIVNKFVDREGPFLGYTADSVETTGTTVTYTFNTNTYREALDKVIELAPSGWYWQVNPNGILSFKAKTVTINHSFRMATHLSSVSPDKNMEDMVNEVYFTGGETAGENLFIKTTRQSSIDSYGRRIKKIVDGRVTVAATAITMSTKLLDERSAPEKRAIILVVDSNGGEDFGYDIESVSVGDNVEILELTAGVPVVSNWDSFVWDTDVWDSTVETTINDVLQITSLSYAPESLELTTTTRLPEISKRIEDINRNFESSVLVNNPSEAS